MVGIRIKRDLDFRAGSKSKSLIAAASMIAGLTLPIAGNAQETMAMVDTAAIAKASTAAASSSVVVSNVTSDRAAESQVSVAAESKKNPITGLEPGTLALIGFGLIALAATRRNAR